MTDVDAAEGVNTVHYSSALAACGPHTADWQCRSAYKIHIKYTAGKPL